MKTFQLTDLDGDKLYVTEGELGAVLWANSHDGEHVGVAVRYRDLPGLIAALTGIAAREDVVA